MQGSSLKRAQKLLLTQDPEPLPQTPQKKDSVLLRAGNSNTLASDEAHLAFLPGQVVQALSLRVAKKVLRAQHETKEKIITMSGEKED